MLGLGLFSPQRAAAEMQLTQVEASGWSAQLPDPNAISAPLLVTRQGFDAAAQPISFVQQVPLTARVRQPYPNHQVLSPDRVALAEPIYIGDTVAGAPNNSTLVAPKPLAMFSRPDHTLVGDRLEVAVCAFSGLPDAAGEAVAAVVFEVSDGSTTLTETVNTMSVSDWGVGDAGGAVLEYQASIDVSALADDVELVVNARIYPHVGAAYADSARNADLFAMEEGYNRRWSPQYFYRNSQHVVIYAYVDPVLGDDATAATSTNPAVAEASPFASIAAAGDAIQGSDGHKVDGHVIRLMAGTHHGWGGASAAARTLYSYLTLERAPGTAKSEVILTSTASEDLLDIDYLKITGITLRRGGADMQFNVPRGNIRPTSAAYALVWVHDCHTDNMGYTGSTDFFSLSFDGYWTQNTHENVGGLFDSQTQLNHWNRGDRFLDLPRRIDMAGFIGNQLLDTHSPIAAIPDVVQDDGAVIAFNRFERANELVLFSTARITYGAAIVQNLIEVTGTANRAIQWGAESTDPANPMNNVIFLHNTVAAEGRVGRVNLFYDDDPGTRHAFTNTCARNNCFGQINIKTDVFGPTSNGANTGNWQARYGCGWSGNWAQSTLAFNQEFAGLYSGIPEGNDTLSGHNFQFVNYQALTDVDGSTPVAGAGGGDYHLQPSSRGARAVPRALPFDLEGNPRAAVTDVGCFEA